MGVIEFIVGATFASCYAAATDIPKVGPTGQQNWMTCYYVGPQGGVRIPGSNGGRLPEWCVINTTGAEKMIVLEFEEVSHTRIHLPEGVEPCTEPTS